MTKKLLIVPTTAGEYTSGATFSVNNETYTITTKADIATNLLGGHHRGRIGGWVVLA